jgi:hypothetical protein
MRAVDTRRDTDNAGILVVDGEVGGWQERPGKSDFHSVALLSHIPPDGRRGEERADEVFLFGKRGGRRERWKYRGFELRKLRCL